MVKTPLLLETICVLEGIPQHLSWHLGRMNTSLAPFYGSRGGISLENLVQSVTQVIQDIPGKSRLRLCYDSPDPRTWTLEHIPYQAPKYQGFIVSQVPDPNYTLKYADRSSLGAIIGPKQEAILWCSNDHIVESPIANLVFEGIGGFVTPEPCLLPGTARARLLSTGRIYSQAIRLEDLEKYHTIHFINAMLDLGECSIPMVHQGYKIS